MKTQLHDLKKDLHTREMQLHHARITAAPDFIVKEIQEQIHNIKSTIYNIQ